MDINVDGEQVAHGILVFRPIQPPDWLRPAWLRIPRGGSVEHRLNRRYCCYVLVVAGFQSVARGHLPSTDSLERLLPFHGDGSGEMTFLEAGQSLKIEACSRINGGVAVDAVGLNKSEGIILDGFATAGCGDPKHRPSTTEDSG
ncbi:MAG: hypothetical protein AAGJ46_18665 [Planctomycetota bacterium]